MTCTVCGARSHKDMHPRCRMGYLRGHYEGMTDATDSFKKLWRAFWALLWFGNGQSR